MTVQIQVIATGLLGVGKTYILNRVADTLREIQNELPGRKIDIVLIEQEKVPSNGQPLDFGPQMNAILGNILTAQRK